MVFFSFLQLVSLYLNALLLGFEIPETHDTISLHFAHCIIFIFCQVVVSLHYWILSHLILSLREYLLDEILHSFFILLC